MGAKSAPIEREIAPPVPINRSEYIPRNALAYWEPSSKGRGVKIQVAMPTSCDLELALWRDFLRNGPSLYRIRRTTL
jgi:hypothetical protein